MRPLSGPYAPWVDLEAELRANNLPLFSVDTHRPAPLFDLLAFNLSAELTYTNLLNCIDLAHVPVRAADRSPQHPLVCAGGHCTYNPEPLADFLDFVVLGDGEEVVSEITEVIGEWKASGRGSREEVLRRLAVIEGVYVPSMYDVEYDGMRIVSVTPASRRFQRPFPSAPSPTSPSGRTPRRSSSRSPRWSTIA